MQKNDLVSILLIALLLCPFILKEMGVLHADTSATSVTVSGGVPSITAGPSDGGVTSTNPVNVGSDVTFTATADDPNGDQYYLAICTTDAVTAGSDAAPTCNDGEWCISSATNDESEATCSTTTVDGWSETEDWYAFVCDKVASGAQCSSSSQGSGDNGSPFHVNHAPNFSDATNDGPANPGATLTVTATASDDDSAHSDTVRLVVCKTQGVSGTACDGGDSDTYCTSTAAASNPSCSFTVDTPAAHGASSTYVYVFDSHDFASDGATHNTAESFTVNDVAPTVSSITLNGGSTIDISTGGEGTSGSVNIYSTSTVTDNNGCDDVSGVTTSAYTTDVGVGSCTSQNGNDCYYNVSCSGSGSCSSGVSKSYVCTINFKYHASPTDTGTPKVDQTWKNTVYALDGSAQGSAELGTGVELQSFVSLDVDASIAYGALTVGQISNTTALPQTATVSSAGNTGIDIQLSGTDMTGAGTIGVAYQKYATSGVNYEDATALSSSPTEMELNISKPTTTSHLAASSTYWGLQVPSGTAAGAYSGTNTFTAVKSETATW